MIKIRAWAQYYVDMLTKLGVIRFSILSAATVIFFSITIQASINYILRGEVKLDDLYAAILFASVVTPWVVFFLSIVVQQLEDSRKRLTKMVYKLQEVRARDLQLQQELQVNLIELNDEFEERKKAEADRNQAFKDLENEVFQREQAQLVVEERSALVRSFIDSSPDLVYYSNECGQFSGCNLSMEALTGKVEKELIGLTPFDAFDTEIAAKFAATDKAVLSTQLPETYEQWLTYPDGHKACFELRKVPFFGQRNEYIGVLGYGRDITERKKYQDALEKASRDKTTFISTISHELRTPLNGVVGLSRILLDGPLNDKQRQHLNTIYVSAQTMGNIFNDIIDLDKFDRRKFEIVNQPIEFRSFLNDIKTLALLQAEQKGLVLEFDVFGEIPDFINADGTRLRQVLWNLVSNAVKFTDSGEVSIRVFTSAEAGNKIGLTFEVEDTGIGISAEGQDKIFAMYYQEQGSKRATGTGIGLSVAKSLMTAMGGDIWVSSELGQGACFTIEFDVDGVDSLQNSSVVESEQTKLQILLVEDIELNVTVCTAILNKLGHTVEVAVDGRSAIQMAEKNDYDLIFLDINLPDISGFEIIKILRENSALELPPVVALTANVINNRQEYIEKGMDDAISKPLSINAVTGVITRLLQSVDQGKKRKVNYTAAALADDREMLEEYLDIELLQQYLETLGKELLLQSVCLFEQTMPNYLAILNTNLTAKDQDAIVDEAHKIKGAAGSIGLVRIQQVSQLAQSPEQPTWWENIDDWVEQINTEYLHDVKRLKNWIENQNV
ncbi:aerobic respiration two-component sensor histidine kinase ArcB [Moritella viscosa]|uniref:Aerobic respiration control sensor protein n=1 Tax=Moritella viscosa TaxID=80854 RepID=A0ABY1HB40_9GAMM|nr:aerobic respiration two-component sensor histidine kinase ArcB [Moritella viscosa]SGY88977.1 Sensor histidine kinase FexB [Moritella viscosa]SGY96667.1 Sensor histidine kinase FexB [Moritella viscosa]SHO25729.1 Sensor histidine kinase FexB [Moritella viscosa]